MTMMRMAAMDIHLGTPDRAAGTHAGGEGRAARIARAVQLGGAA